MTRLRTISTLGLCIVALPGAMLAQQQPAWEIESLGGQEGGVVYDIGTGWAMATNGVVVKYGGALLTADRIAANQASGEVVADGTVRIERDDQIWAGDHIRYNFLTHQMEAEQFRTGKAPFFAGGSGLHGEWTNKVYVATNAFITTDDVAKPAIQVRAKSIRIIPGDRIEARHATLYLEGVPVFYFPYYSRKLDPRSNHFDFIPGYRSHFGPFLLGSYTWFLNEQLDGIVHVDYRQLRGVGAGPDVNYHLGRWGEGTAKYYYLHDEDPSANAPKGTVPDNRQRVWFAYQSNPYTNLQVKALVRYQGDSNIVREFFEGEYRHNPQPSTYVEVNKFWQNFSLDLYTQPRVNDFLETVERLPDVRLTGFRQQLGDSPLYYESESSAGYYRRLFPETNDITLHPDYSAGRADTYHQVLLPETFFGWLNLTPRVGGRFSYYTEASGPGATTEEVYRGVFNTGAELSFKASRLWPATENKFLEVDGLRHIFEPRLNYVYVPTPTARGTNELPQFDYELPSLRLLPIDFPDYNAIDSIDSQNVIRMGMRNKLQTKRGGQIVDLVNWDLYTDWRLDPRPDQTTFADLYSDLMFRPRSWLALESLIRYDLDGGQFRLAFETLTIRPSNLWSWSLTHYYLQDDFRPVPTALGQGNNLLISRIYYRINENWGLMAAHHFEARDGRMEEQSYSVYRDMRSWTAALSFRLRNNRVGPDDFTVAFTFSLKAFPRYGLGDDTLRPYWLLGG